MHGDPLRSLAHTSPHKFQIRHRRTLHCSSPLHVAIHLAGSHKWPKQHKQQNYPHPTPALSRDLTDWTGDGTVTMIGGCSIGPDPSPHVSPDRVQPRGKVRMLSMLDLYHT